MSKPIIYEELLKRFSIPNAILKDNRQEGNAIISEDEFRSIMSQSHFKEFEKPKIKRSFQYW
jgi:hypothetical protein